MKLNMYPTEFEVYDNEEMIAKFKTMDSVSLSVTIDDKILSNEEFETIRKMYIKAHELLEEGIRDDKANNELQS